MNESRCPHCQKTGFEAVAENVSGYPTPTPPVFIRCKSCKTVISVLDPTDIGASLSNIGRQIQELLRKS